MQAPDVLALKLVGGKQDEGLVRIVLEPHLLHPAHGIGLRNHQPEGQVRDRLLLQVVVTAEQRAEAHVEGMRELRVVDVAALVHVHRDPQRLLVGLEDLRHCGNDHVAAVAGEHGNAQLLLRRGPLLRKVLEHVPGAHRLLRHAIERLAVLGERQVLRRAVEEPAAEPVLELAHRPARRGRAHRVLVRGREERTRLHHRAKELDRPCLQFHFILLPDLTDNFIFRNLPCNICILQNKRHKAKYFPTRQARPETPSLQLSETQATRPIQRTSDRPFCF